MRVYYAVMYLVDELAVLAGDIAGEEETEGRMGRVSCICWLFFTAVCYVGASGYGLELPWQCLYYRSLNGCTTYRASRASVISYDSCVTQWSHSSTVVSFELSG